MVLVLYYLGTLLIFSDNPLTKRIDIGTKVKEHLTETDKPVNFDAESLQVQEIIESQLENDKTSPERTNLSV